MTVIDLISSIIVLPNTFVVKPSRMSSNIYDILLHSQQSEDGETQYSSQIR